MTRHMLAPILLSPPPPVPHDMCPSEGKNHVQDLPVGFAHGPVIQGLATITTLSTGPMASPPNLL